MVSRAATCPVPAPAAGASGDGERRERRAADVERAEEVDRRRRLTSDGRFVLCTPGVPGGPNPASGKTWTVAARNDANLGRSLWGLGPHQGDPCFVPHYRSSSAGLSSGCGAAAPTIRGGGEAGFRGRSAPRSRRSTAATPPASCVPIHPRITPARPGGWTTGSTPAYSMSFTEPVR